VTVGDCSRYIVTVRRHDVRYKRIVERKSLDASGERSANGWPTAHPKASGQRRSVLSVVIVTRHQARSTTRNPRRTDRSGGEDGFTFIELCVGMIVLGILAAIAVPTFLSHSRAAADKLAHSDLRNAVTLLEACAVESGYPTRVNAVGVMNGCAGQRISLSDHTRLRYRTTGSPVTSFVLASVNTDGSGHQVYCYNSVDGGGSVEEIGGSLAGATC
jgi:type IV pilus assembly protein PilA